jgi:hypothetical protein
MITWREFGLWRAGVTHALDGGLWLHRFMLFGEAWAHLVSADRGALVTAGHLLEMPESWLQYPAAGRCMALGPSTGATRAGNRAGRTEGALPPYHPKWMTLCC